MTPTMSTEPSRPLPVLPPVPPAPVSAPEVLRLTADEFLARHGAGRAELVKGLVRELPMPGFDHGLICALMSRLLGNFVTDARLGRVVGNDTFFRTNTNPDSVRGMDIGYISFARLPAENRPRGVLEVPPELVVEVRSPSDTWTEIFAQVVEYLQAGVAVVVVIDPETQTASVYRPHALQEIYRNDDRLILADVLPGFAVPVATLFE